MPSSLKSQTASTLYSVFGKPVRGGFMVTVVISSQVQHLGSSFFVQEKMMIREMKYKSFFIVKVLVIKL